MYYENLKKVTILETLFLFLSFALPFYKRSQWWIMVDVLWKFIMVLHFLMDYAIVTTIFICSLLIAWLLRKGWTKFLVAGSYLFLILWIATEGYFFRMSLEDLIRLWTSLEFLTKTYQLGFYLNILLGILLIIKYLKVKQ